MKTVIETCRCGGDIQRRTWSVDGDGEWAHIDAFNSYDSTLCAENYPHQHAEPQGAFFTENVTLKAAPVD